MGYTKDKNLITYTGKQYTIHCDILNRKLETNHVDGLKYIIRTTSRTCDINGELIYCIAKVPDINPFIETLATQAKDIFYAIVRSIFDYNITFAKEMVDRIQKNWKIINKKNNSTGYLQNDCYTFLRGLVYEADGERLGLNELENKWHKKGIIDIDFLKHFAGQLEMYESLINNDYVQILINWYNSHKIKTKPYLKNKNLLQALSEMDANKQMIEDKTITDKLEKISNKYSFLETTDADGWTYNLLKTNKDFKQEAEIMHNCLVRCKYNEKMSKEECLILVAIRPDGKRIDIELHPTSLDIKQCYYKYDSYVTEIDKNHISNYLKGIRELQKSL